MPICLTKITISKKIPRAKLKRALKAHHGYVVWDPVTIEIECNEALSFKSFIKRDPRSFWVENH